MGIYFVKARNTATVQMAGTIFLTAAGCEEATSNSNRHRLCSRKPGVQFQKHS
jgi:hypothetical protein